jgi:hypothetical protein
MTTKTTVAKNEILEGVKANRNLLYNIIQGVVVIGLTALIALVLNLSADMQLIKYKLDIENGKSDNIKIELTTVKARQVFVIMKLNAVIQQQNTLHKKDNEERIEPINIMKD